MNEKLSELVGKEVIVCHRRGWVVGLLEEDSKGYAVYNGFHAKFQFEAHEVFQIRNYPNGITIYVPKG